MSNTIDVRFYWVHWLKKTYECLDVICKCSLYSISYHALCDSQYCIRCNWVWPVIRYIYINVNPQTWGIFYMSITQIKSLLPTQCKIDSMNGAKSWLCLVWNIYVSGVSFCKVCRRVYQNIIPKGRMHIKSVLNKKWLCQCATSVD